MKQTTYREHDYTFGKIMRALRSTIGLTQKSLAEVLGVSRRTVVDWEAGNKYLNADHLTAFITLALEHRAFHVGQEAEEIRTLWEVAHQKVLLDETWLTSLLNERLDGRWVDWGDAPAVPYFFGREWERNLLTTWVVEQRCRVVSVLGQGGIGKSALVVHFMHQVAEDFQIVVWRSLRDAPSCIELLNDLLQVLAPTALGEGVGTLEQRLNQLPEFLRSHRTLIVLDNMEVILEEGENMGQIRAGLQDYARLLRCVAETNHQSCLVLTSREKFNVLVALEGSNAPVRSLRLTQLDSRSCAQLLTEKGVTGTPSEEMRLTEIYAGNPLALKIVTQTIVDLFQGKIGPFLEQGEVIFGGVRELLQEQFDRLSSLEQTLLLWLAILREPSNLDNLLALFVRPVPRGRLLEAMDALHRRSLVERGQKAGFFTLQAVVLEYVITRLITEASNELLEGRLVRLVEHGLELAQAPEYVRQIQERLLVEPLLIHLRSEYLRPHTLEDHLMTLLASMRTWTEDAQGFGPANLATLLRHMRGNLNNLDLSYLVFRQAYLQGVEMQDTRLVYGVNRDSVFTESCGGVAAIAYSSTGEYWASASTQGLVCLWAADGQVINRMWQAHTTSAWVLEFSPDGQSLLSGSLDGTLKLWDVTSGTLLWTVTHVNYFQRAAFSSNGRFLASCGDATTILIWDMISDSPLHTLPHQGLLVSSIAWSPNGSLLAIGDAEGSIHFWEFTDSTESFVRTQTFGDHTNIIGGLDFTPDGYTLASASWDGTVKLWEVADGQLQHTLAGHTDCVHRLVWSFDGQCLASGGSDGKILLWDVERRDYKLALKDHTANIWGLAFAPDGRRLLSGSEDGTLREWDITNGQSIRIIQSYAAAIFDVDWSPDGKQLVSGAADRSVTVWDLHTAKSVRRFCEHRGSVGSVGWSSNGQWIASSGSDNTIHLWNLTSDDSFKSFSHPDDTGNNHRARLTWSPDGGHLAWDMLRGGVQVFEVGTDHPRWMELEFTTWMYHISWRPEGKVLAGAGDDRKVYIWDAEREELLQQMAGHHSPIRRVAWSPAGTQLASAGGDSERGELIVWDPQQGDRLYTFAGQSGIVFALAWGLIDKVVVSGSSDGRLQWWDIQSGACLWDREAHNGAVRSLRRSPDGTKLASCGDDGTIKIWDQQNGDCLQVLRHDRPYERLDITGVQGLTEAQLQTLRVLGAIDDVGRSREAQN